MATSTCVKCGGTSFEYVEHTPKNSRFKLHFTQCAGCGGVVGVQEWGNVGYLVRKLAEKLGHRDLDR